MTTSGAGASRPSAADDPPRRPRLRRFGLGAVVVLVIVAVGVAWYLRPIAPIATGYAAEITCSGVFLSERDAQDVAGDLPSNPLVPFLRTDVDASAGKVSTSLLGAWRSTAWVSAHGCTLAEERPPFPPLAERSTADEGAAWPQGDGPAQLPPDVDAERVSAALDEAFSEDGTGEDRTRGTRAVAVVHDGQLIAERYADGFAADTPLLGWSMGKSLANAVIGRLVGSGDLALDDASLVAAWADDERDAITLQQLLQMTSGLAFEEVYDPGTDATRMLFRPGDTAAYAASQPLEASPGTRWHYSSGTTNILCDVAQEASGSGPELVEELLFDPLGMTSAVVQPDASGTPVCSSFPYATARDWARFGQLFLDDGVWDGQRLLPEDWVSFSTSPVELESEEPYGAQWWLNAGTGGELRMPAVPADAYWASGNEGQQVVVVPSADLVVVRLGLSTGYSGVGWGLEPLVAELVDTVG